MTDPRYAIIAATFHGNRGAQAMLETVIGRLRAASPSARFDVYSYYARADRALVRDPAITIHDAAPLALAWLVPTSMLFGLLCAMFGRRMLRLAPASVRGIGHADAMVDLAGVAFMDGRAKFLPFNVLTLLPARVLGTPLVKMPQALGPFRHAGNRLLAAWCLRGCDMVWARGSATVGYLAGAGFEGVRTAQADDVAFNHRDEDDLTFENVDAEARFRADIAKAALTRDGSGVGILAMVGICPSAVVAARVRRRGGAHAAEMAALVHALSRQRIQVVLVPNASREAAGAATRNNDLPLIAEIRAATMDAALPPLAFQHDIGAAGVRRIIAATDLVVVSRFHAMVAALSSEVPVVVVGWSHKYREVMERFGLASLVVDALSPDGEALLQRVLAAVHDRDAIASQIRERLPAVRASAAVPVDTLLVRQRHA